MRSFDILLKELEAIAPDKAAVLVKRIEAILDYEPRVGVFGKTGSGKIVYVMLCSGLKFQQSVMYLPVLEIHKKFSFRLVQQV